jgi:hypothetical protein
MHETILNQYSILVPPVLPESHCPHDLHVLLHYDCLRWYIGHIIVHMYVTVVHDLATMMILTHMVAHFDLLPSGLDHGGSDMC